jgi:hypothetical protein
VVVVVEKKFLQGFAKPAPEEGGGREVATSVGGMGLAAPLPLPSVYRGEVGLCCPQAQTHLGPAHELVPAWSPTFSAGDYIHDSDEEEAVLAQTKAIAEVLLAGLD